MKLHYIGIPILAIFAFMFGGIIKGQGLAWYQSLSIPSWHPSHMAIAIIWAIIYFAAAASALLIWNTVPRDRNFHIINALFVITALVNFIWSVTFFSLHQLMAASYCAIVLAVLAALLMVRIWPLSRRAALLLIPYFLWISFASYLISVVASLNP